MARQVVLKPETKQHIMVAIKACGLTVVEPRTLSTSCQSTLSAREMMDISPNQPLYILVSKFSDRDIHLLEHMNISQTAEPPSINEGINTDDRECSPIQNTERSTSLTFYAPDGNADIQASYQTDVTAENYISAESRRFQLLLNAALRNATSQNARDWQEEVKLFDKY